MADKSAKYPENSDGRFYVDNACIACDACVTSAPDNFVMDEKAGHAYIKRQPQSPEEEEQCKEAMDGCPVEAIGNDGEC